MAAAGGVVVHCGVSVEVAGKALHPAAKGAKGVAVQIVPGQRGSPGHIQVLGFRRDICLRAGTVQQLVDSRLAEGRLAVVVRDGMKVILAKAQPAQLEQVAQCLRGIGPASAANAGGAAGAAGAAVCRGAPGGADGPPAKRPRPGTTPGPTPGPTPRREATAATGAAGRATPRAGASAPAAAASEAGEAAGGGAGAPEAPPASLASLADLPAPVLEGVLELARLSASELAAMAQGCRALADHVLGRRQPVLCVAARGAGVPTDHVVRAVARRRVLHTLDLSGFAELASSAAARLADALRGAPAARSAPAARTGPAARRGPAAGATASSGGDGGGAGGCGPGAGLRTLRLRGCKALSGAAVRRVLLACTALEVFDALDIPRLGDDAFPAPEALPALRVLAVGALGRRCSAAAPAPRGGTVSTAAGVVSAPTAAMAQYQGSARVTPELLAKGDPPPLTHLILASCGDMHGFPRALSESLLHLDLQGAALRPPAGAPLAGWRPLAGCARLQALCLAGCLDLGVGGLAAVLASLPAGAPLGALDLSDTRADGAALAAVARLPATAGLARLRLAGCGSVTNAALAGVLRARPALELLDVSGCRALGPGLSDVAPEGHTGALASNLRVLGVAATPLAERLDAVRSAARALTPQARVVASQLELFGPYFKL